MLALASCTVEAPHAAVTSKSGDAKVLAPAPKVSEPAPVLAPAPDTAPEPADDAFDVRARVAPSPDAVVVTDAGAEPRRVLAVAGRVDEARSLRLVLALKVGMDLGTRRVPPTELPPLVVTLRAAITESNAEGVAVALAVTDVTADAPEGTTPRVRDALARTADRLRSTTGTMRLAKDGRVLAFDLASAGTETGGAKGSKPGTPELEPELGGLSAALQELLPAVPSSAVGNGARWTSVSHVRRDAVRLEQSGTWTLALEGDTATATLESSHVATTDDADAPGMIEATSGTTKATIVLGDGPLPLRANATIDTTTQANLELIGAPQRVGLRTTLTLTLEDIGPTK